jgi:signal recognition particle subunit SRP54
MTKYERDNYRSIDKSRRKRIAHGSGKSEQEVEAFIKKFGQMSEMMTGMTRLGKNTGPSSKKKNKTPWGKSYF